MTPTTCAPPAGTEAELVDRLRQRAESWRNPTRTGNSVMTLSYERAGSLEDEAAATIERLTREHERLRLALAKSNEEICQTLGRALGYPWFKDDQKNFPGATTADGVCVGEHVAESIAAEAAKSINTLRQELAETETAADTDDAASHSALVLLAEKWLWRQNCGVVFRDAFRATTEYGEQPDAIGWRGATSILVECKATRADFGADLRKKFRMEPKKGVGDWRFYLCPDNMVAVTDLPPGWGLLYAKNKRVTPVHGVPGNVGWRSERPFAGDKRCETQMLYSALRRLVLRGHFESIYDPIVSGEA